MDNDILITPEWLLSHGFEEFDINDQEYIYDGIAESMGARFFREKDFHRNLFIVELYDLHEGFYESYCVFVQIDAGCGFVEQPLRWSYLTVDRLNDLYSAFMDKKLG